MQHKTLGLLCSVGAITFISVQAHAQVTEGALQLGVGTSLATYTSQSVTDNQADGTRDTTDYKSFRWGFHERSGVLVEGGYGLGDSLVLGGIVGLGGWSGKQKADQPFANEVTNSSFDLVLAPKVDYMFLPGGMIRPFVGGALGLVYRSDTLETRSGRTGATTTDVDRGLTGLWLMARGGARFFLTPGFSIDPALTFTWIPTASGSVQGAQPASFDSSGHAVSIGLSLGISGWIGL